MSFDRPGLPVPGHELDPTVEETLGEEGVEMTDDEPHIPEHPGGRSLGPQPNTPRHPSHEAPPEKPADS